MKICSKCKIKKQKSDFPYQNKSLDKIMSCCKECSNYRQRQNRKDNLDKTRKNDKKQYAKHRKKRIIAAREYRKKYPDRTRKTNLKVKYGITPKDYDYMLDKQGGMCAICGEHNSKLKRMLFVDHCHKTGKVRGLLCDTCNKFLGFFEKLGDKCFKYLK